MDDSGNNRDFEVVYHELRAIARRERMRRPLVTLNTTSIVHEAWLKLQAQDARWRDRNHYVGTAAVAMRRVLMDYLRYSLAAKRDARKNTRIFETFEQTGVSAEELLDINSALERLEALDPPLAELIHLRFFAGLTLEETAKVKGISVRTATRMWAKARAFLQAHLQELRQ